jgi:hypothetical protein
MGYHKVDDRIHAIPKTVLSGTLKDFYSRMYFRCNHKNKSWWGYAKLSKEFQVSTRTVGRWCQKLRSLKMIETRRTGRANEMSIITLTEEDFREFGVPEEILRKARKDADDQSDRSPMSDQIGRQCPIHIKGKEKMKKKSGSATRKATFDSLWGDDDVQASSKRAVDASKKRGAMPTVMTAAGVEVVPEDEDALDVLLARWSPRQWAQGFVRAMRAAGYSVAFHKYNTLVEHFSAIRDHLINREFSRVKIHRFLLEWFPNVYSSICEEVFKKDPEDFMVSVSWMEPRLSKLVSLFEEGERKPKRSSKKVIDI